THAAAVPAASARSPRAPRGASPTTGSTRARAAATGSTDAGGATTGSTDAAAGASAGSSQVAAAGRSPGGLDLAVPPGGAPIGAVGGMNCLLEVPSWASRADDRNASQAASRDAPGRASAPSGHTTAL